MKLFPGKVMDECGEEHHPTLLISSNTSPNWIIRMDSDESLQIETDHQIEAPGVTINISNRAFYTSIRLNPRDAITLGEELVELAKTALPHNYYTWQEKSVMKDIVKNHAELLQKKKNELFNEWAHTKTPEIKKHQAEQFILPLPITAEAK